MAAYNKVLLMGNLTRDPQLKFLPSQMAVVEFGIACNRKYRTSGGEDREEVTFVDCTAWGKTGEAINQHLTKGSPIFVEGHLKYESWDDKNGGGKRSKLSVTVDNFQFVGGRPDGDETDQRPSPARGKGYGGGKSLRERVASRPQVENPISEGREIDIDDIPFRHRLPERWI